MNEVTLPPSPNWYLNNVMSCSKNGTVAWGSRHTIVIGQPKENSKILEYSIILNAHSERVTSLCLSPEFDNSEKRLLVSAGDDHNVKIWKVDTLTTTLTNSILDAKQKVIGVDWSKNDPNLICYASAEGFLVSWNIAFDTNQIIPLGKATPTCISCCPHDPNLVALGSKKGTVLIVNIQGSGSVIYNLRGHDVEVVSLSWCPVSSNIFVENGARDLLLASGGKDRSIFFWRAGGDGRFQCQIMLPQNPLDSQKHRSKLGAGSFNWTALCWAEAKLILISSAFGELISWDLTKFSGKNKPVYQTIHTCHNRGLFCIATDVQIENNDRQPNWREKNSRRIWTLGQDRQVICCDLLEDKSTIEYRIPTQGGYVYCLAACPLDTTQIAFGSGDAMLRIWNLSEPHESQFEIATLWQKIMGKVRALSWHPEKENLLAFGTGEGRIGIYDTNAKKPPLLYRQYHRNVIYSLHWGPAPDVQLYALYSCGDGELVFYNPENPDKDPKSVIKKDCTEFAWKPDYSCMAVGSEHGKISFFDRNLKELEDCIYNPLRTAVHCLAWHPESTETDLSMSPLQNYLAVAFNSSTITIFDICDLKVSTDEKETVNVVDATESKAFYKTVAILSGHTEKVVSLIWSPHQSGFLASGSYDNTIQIWKVETQEIIATFTGHLGPVFSCMWSPLDPDFMISGSADFTVQIWKISEQEAIMPTEKPTSRKVKTKKKKNNLEKALTLKSNDNEEDLSKSRANEQQQNVLEKKNNSKKDSKKREYFTVYSKRLNTKTAVLESIRTLINSVKGENESEKEGESEEKEKTGDVSRNVEENSEKQGETEGVKESREKLSETVEEREKVEEKEKESREIKEINEVTESNDNDKQLESRETNVPSIFAGKEHVLDIIKEEKPFLNSRGQYNAVLELDVWCNKLMETLKEAVKEKRLTDYLVSLAPSLSMKTWQEMCEAYAMQLISDGHINKAVCYLLKIHRIHQAVGAFFNAKMYREAYALAALKLDPQDPLVENILRDWATSTTREGSFEEAVQCYVKLKDFKKAAQLLSRRKEVSFLDVAAELAEMGEDIKLSDSLAEQAVNESLLISDFETANSICEKYSRIRHRQIHVNAFKVIKNALDTSSPKSISDWLEGKSRKNGVLESLQNFPSNGDLYLELGKSIFNAPPKCENELWINVSHQISLAALSESENQLTKHILMGLQIICSYEKTQYHRDETSESLLLKFLSILENKDPSSEESLFSKKNERTKALRAYLCYGFLNWFTEEYLRKEDTEKNYDFMMNTIEKYIKDVFDKETVKHWTGVNEIVKLEALLALNIGKTQTPEDEKLEPALTVERLDHLRFDGKQFLENRVSTPNPMDAYVASFDFVNQISNENVKIQMKKLIDDAWQEASAV